MVALQNAHVWLFVCLAGAATSLGAAHLGHSTQAGCLPARWRLSDTLISSWVVVMGLVTSRAPSPSGLLSVWAFVCLLTAARPEGSLLLPADGCLGLAKETSSSIGKRFLLDFPGSLAYGGLGVQCWSLQDPRDGMEP